MLMASHDPERLLTVEEIAERVRVTTETVRRWLRDWRRTGGREGLRGLQLAPRKGWRVREADLSRFLEQHFPSGEGQV